MNQVFQSNHFEKMVLCLNSQRQEAKKYCDVTLEVDGKDFPVHRAVLSSMSDYFDKLFTTEMIEKYQDCIEISGVTADVLELILSFLYTGKVVIDQENVYDIIAAAHYLTIPQLVEFCSTFLLEHISLDYCIRTWLTSCCYNMEKLNSDYGKFIAQNFDNISKKEDFLQLESANVTDIIRLKNEKGSCEESAYRAILAWVYHNLDARKENFDKLFEMLSLETFTKLYLAETVTKEDLVRQNPVSFKKTLDAMSLMMTWDLDVPDHDRSFLACNEDFTIFRLMDIETKVQAIISRRTEPRYEACVVVMDGFLYLIGGYINSKDEPTNSVLRLKVKRPEVGWEKVQPMRLARRSATVSPFQNAIRVEGGFGASGDSVDVKEDFSPKYNMWISSPAPSDLSESEKASTSTDGDSSHRESNPFRFQLTNPTFNFVGASPVRDVTSHEPKRLRVSSVDSIKTLDVHKRQSCACPVRDVSASCGNATYNFKQDAHGPISLIVQTSKASQYKSIRLDKGDRIVDTCTVRRKIIATAHAHDAEGVYHFLGVFNTEHNTWRVLQSLENIEDFHKLASLESSSSTSSAGKE